jgi:hypothetical protein
VGAVQHPRQEMPNFRGSFAENLNPEALFLQPYGCRKQGGSTGPARARVVVAAPPSTPLTSSAPSNQFSCAWPSPPHKVMPLAMHHEIDPSLSNRYRSGASKIYLRGRHGVACSPLVACETTHTHRAKATWKKGAAISLTRRQSGETAVSTTLYRGRGVRNPSAEVNICTIFARSPSAIWQAPHDTP